MGEERLVRVSEPPTDLFAPFACAAPERPFVPGDTVQIHEPPCHGCATWMRAVAANPAVPTDDEVQDFIRRWFERAEAD